MIKLKTYHGEEGLYGLTTSGVGFIGWENRLRLLSRYCMHAL